MKDYFRHYHIPELQTRIRSATLYVKHIETTEDYYICLVGWSICMPEDNFCRKTGRELAVSMAETRGYRVYVDKKNPEKLMDAVLASLLALEEWGSQDQDFKRFLTTVENFYEEIDTVLMVRKLNKYKKKLTSLKANFTTLANVLPI